jgi:ParB family chromosome partitioning protein
MSHTEKAAVLTLHHSKMFSQGKRNDIIAELKMLDSISKKTTDTNEPTDGGGNNEEKGKAERKKWANEAVAEKYSLCPANVSRYLRIQYLVSGLQIMLDNNKLGFTAAVTLSFVPAEEQKIIAHCAMSNQLVIDGKKATMLRTHSDNEGLDGESVYKILSGVMNPKPPRNPKVEIHSATFMTYFNPKQSKDEINERVDAALKFYFEHNPELIAGIPGMPEDDEE